MTRLKNSFIPSLLCSLCSLVANSQAGGSWLADGRSIQPQSITREFADNRYLQDHDAGDIILIETPGFGNDLKLHSSDSDMKFNVGSGTGVFEIWTARMAVDGDVTISGELSTASTAPNPEWEFPGRYVGNRDYNDVRYLSASYTNNLGTDESLIWDAGQQRIPLPDSAGEALDGHVPVFNTVGDWNPSDSLFAVTAEGDVADKVNGHAPQWSNPESAPNSTYAKFGTGSLFNGYRWNYYDTRAIDQTTDFEIHFWMMSTAHIDSSTGANLLAIYSTINSEKIFNAYFSHENPRVLLKGGAQITLSDLPANDFGWHHYCLSFSASEQVVRVYRDGQLEGSASFTEPFRIDNNHGGYNFKSSVIISGAATYTDNLIIKFGCHTADSFAVPSDEWGTPPPKGLVASSQLACTETAIHVKAPLEFDSALSSQTAGLFKAFVPWDSMYDFFAFNPTYETLVLSPSVAIGLEAGELVMSQGKLEFPGEAVIDFAEHRIGGGWWLQDVIDDPKAIIHKEFADNRYIQRSEGITTNHVIQAGDTLQIQNGIITAINP